MRVQSEGGSSTEVWGVEASVFVLVVREGWEELVVVAGSSCGFELASAESTVICASSGSGIVKASTARVRAKNREDLCLPRCALIYRKIQTKK
jgi:hypothetical protein